MLILVLVRQQNFLICKPRVLQLLKNMLSSTVKGYMRDPVRPVLVYKKSGEILDKLKETKSSTMIIFRFFFILFLNHLLK